MDRRQPLLMSLLFFVSILAVCPRSFAKEELPTAKKTAPTTVAPAAAKAASPSDVLKDLEKLHEKNPADLKTLFALATEYRKQKEEQKAIQVLWSQIKILDRKGMLLLMSAYESTGDWSETIRVGNLILSKNQKDEEAWTRIGNAQFMRKKTGAAKVASETEAKESLKKALEINPKYQPAYEALVRIYEKNPYEQRLLYQDMIDHFGPRASFLTKLCTLNTSDGENEQGEQYCNQAINRDAKIPDNHVNLGIIAKQKGEPEKARKLLFSAADKFPTSEMAQYEAGAYAEQEKSWIEAYKYYSACVAAEATSERCLVGIGNSGVQIQEYEKALNAFRLACHKSGRKYAPLVRRATTTIQARKNANWADKFDAQADRCAYQ